MSAQWTMDASALIRPHRKPTSARLPTAIWLSALSSDLNRGMFLRSSVT